jgi:hypothetical protein
MLSKAHADESSIKTVTLARGSYSEVAGPIPGFLNSRSRTTSDKSNAPRNDSSEDVRLIEPTEYPSYVLQGIY